MENKITEMSVNLNTLGKSKLHLELTDEKHTKITVLSPTKALADKVNEEYNQMKNGNAHDSMAPYYSIVASVLSNNMERINFTPEEIESMFGFDDLINIFVVLNQFILGIKNAKN